MYTVSMNPSNPDALAWYTFTYTGEEVTFDEARDLAEDLNQDLRLMGRDGSVRFYIHANGAYYAA